MTLDGVGTDQIATQLSSDMVLVPMAYWASKGLSRGGKAVPEGCTAWCRSTVIKILTLQEYCGDLINFKTYSKSYKNKKRLNNDPENMVVFRGVNEPIIDRATWEKVQEKRGKIRKRKPHSGDRNMFSGLVVCADCGRNLNFHFNQGNHDIQYFNCSNYNSGHGTCNATHYIRVDFLEQVVLGEIRRLTKFASHYESEFVKAVMGHSQQAAIAERQYKEKELNRLLARDKELDRLFERLYEDNVAGKLSDERYARMARSY
ncbi:MAG: recombinase family protein [Eubacteriales bacterium]|nr:recombinase family protein [Eubacteriales bacterium]MDD3880686.1 recombinase family protein [Eubacteriales bacterium]MDD4511680.1 recombinase family protein [Eubacteriales bacterium]